MTTDPLVESELTEPIGPSVSEGKAVAKTGTRIRPLPFLLAFVIAVLAFLALGTAVALGMSQMYGGRVLPSVHVGSADLSGLTREQAITKLTTEYAYLSDGQVTVETPVGTAKITYKEIGRGPDVEAMADAALQVGRQGDPIANAAAAVRAVATGTDRLQRCSGQRRSGRRRRHGLQGDPRRGRPRDRRGGYSRFHPG